MEESSEPNEEDMEQAIEHTDEDSKSSEVSSASAASTEDSKEIRRPTRMKRSDFGLSLSPSSSRGKNPRKSPRQHASTLAILSSLVNQRKRRSRNVAASEVPPVNLQTIPEEPPAAVAAASVAPEVVVEQKPEQNPVEQKEAAPVEPKPATPQRKRKKKIDYFAIAAKIDEELNTALDFDIDFEPTTEPDASFIDSRVNVEDILRMYDESKAKENENSCRRFFNGAPGRKPGKRKKNLTGWPNKVKRKRVAKEENGSVNGGNAETDEDEENGESNSIIEAREAEADLDDRENKCDQDIENRVGNGSEIRDTILQPYVYVKKLDNCEEYGVKKLIIKSPAKRTIRRPQRRIIPPTVKSPRILRRPKGRWYRDR